MIIDLIVADSERGHFSHHLAQLLDSDAILNFKSASDDKGNPGNYAMKADDVHMAACTSIVYLGGREEMKSQCELCKFCTVFHYWVTN